MSVFFGPVTNSNFDEVAQLELRILRERKLIVDDLTNEMQNIETLDKQKLLKIHRALKYEPPWYDNAVTNVLENSEDVISWSACVKFSITQLATNICVFVEMGKNGKRPKFGSYEGKQVVNPVIMYDAPGVIVVNKLFSFGRFGGHAILALHPF
jgi:hypothetical protein